MLILIAAQISALTQAEAVWRVPFLCERPPVFLRVLQPGNTPSLLPSVSAAPRCNPLSNHPTPLVHPALPANASSNILRMLRRRRILHLDRPMAQTHSLNALNGLIIDSGYHWTDVYDGFSLTRSRASTPTGIKAFWCFWLRP